MSNNHQPTYFHNYESLPLPRSELPLQIAINGKSEKYSLYLEEAKKGDRSECATNFSGSCSRSRGKRRSSFASPLAHNLFKKSKEVDINDPKLTFLPPKSASHKCLHAKINVRNDKGPLSPKQLNKNSKFQFDNVALKIKSGKNQKHPIKICEDRESQRATEQEMGSLTRIIMFQGDLSDASYKIPAVTRFISNSGEEECKNLIKLLQQ